MKQIGKSSYAHSEVVTCVKLFNNLLISSSEDNIINVFLLNPIADHNLLNKMNVEMTVNLGQSIYSVILMEMVYLSAITTVNTFHVVNLNLYTNKNLMPRINSMGLIIFWICFMILQDMLLKCFVGLTKEDLRCLNLIYKIKMCFLM